MAGRGFHGSNAPTKEESYALADKMYEDFIELMRTKYNIVGGKNISYELRPLWDGNAAQLKEVVRELTYIHDCDNW